MICVGLFAEDKITGVPTGHGLFGGQSHDELRVSRDKEEIEGLDLGEHGMEAPFLANPPQSMNGTNCTRSMPVQMTFLRSLFFQKNCSPD